jgi:hypothetical protein
VDILTLANLKALGKREFSEKTVFSSRIAGIINFDQAAEEELQGENIAAEKECYIFKSRIPGKNGQDDKWYYCILSKNKVDGRYPLSVVSEAVIKETLKKGAVKFAHESIDSKDKEIIDIYTAHEITTVQLQPEVDTIGSF